MNVKGKVFQIVEPVTGESAKGPWKKQEFVIETMDQYPKKIAFTVWNDKVELSTLSEGSEIDVFFNAESREHNGRWYTDLGAWKLEAVQGAVDNYKNNQTPPPPAESVAPADDLPF